MSRSYCWLLLLALALAALPAGTAPATPERFAATSALAASVPRPATLGPEFMGLSIRDPWYEFGTSPHLPNAPNEAFQSEMGAVVEQAGAGWVRLEFHIPYDANVADPCDDNCQSEIAKNDYFINTIAPQHNLKVLALLGFGMLRGNDPCLLNKNPVEVSPRFGGGVNPAIVAWLTRALAIADRYQERIAAYEILNEQNRLDQCGTPAVVFGKTIKAIAPTITGRMITKLYRFCHGIAVPPDEPSHGCADAKIILGGIHPRGSSAPGSSATTFRDSQYLTAIYTDTASFAAFRSDPDHPYYPVDGIGYHPYPEEIRLSPKDVYVDLGMDRMRRALEHIDNQGASDACRQFWITEVGYNVGFDPDGPANPRPAQTEAGQAALMQDVYTSLAQRQLDSQLCGSTPEVANVFWFKYEDFPPATGPNAQQWGIVRIPILPGNCEGGCYDPTGVPILYRKSFAVFRALSGYRTYVPMIMQEAQPTPEPPLPSF
jgi:hypothetical protein